MTDEAFHRHLAGCFQEGETALSMAMRSVNPQCVLFARAVYEAALEKCNSSKSFKSKYPPLTTRTCTQQTDRP